jgi:signal transduction histidine kinase
MDDTAAPRRAGRILVVDDEPANVELLKKALALAGYEDVRGITDAGRVMDHVVEFQPDLILLDLLMPHPDGLEVLAELREALPVDAYLPVLMLTADASRGSRQKALAGGAKDFLTKPFDLDEVLQRIANMLETRRLHLALRAHNRELEERVRQRTEELERALAVEREATTQLRLLEEMKNTFLTAVSHELRTPLTAVLGGALTLDRSGSNLSEEERASLARGMVKSGKRLNTLLADLLDLDRLARGIADPVRKPTDVGALIDRVVQDSELPQDHPLDVDADHLTADVDTAKVERIVQNLLFNAVRHTPPGTNIGVRARMQAGGLLIVVEDDGPGVPERLRAAIFEPFQQGEQRADHAPGVGVGLSLVSRFAELHGGSAWVEERPGGGASFRVFLPTASVNA